MPGPEFPDGPDGRVSAEVQDGQGNASRQGLAHLPLSLRQLATKPDCDGNHTKIAQRLSIHTHPPSPLGRG